MFYSFSAVFLYNIFIFVDYITEEYLSLIVKIIGTLLAVYLSSNLGLFYLTVCLNCLAYRVIVQKFISKQGEIEFIIYILSLEEITFN